MQLALQGCDVTALEPNKVLRDITLLRWEEIMSAPYSFDTVGHLALIKSFARGSRKKWPPKMFDLIVAMTSAGMPRVNGLV